MNQAREFTGYDKYYSFNIYDYINVKYDIHVNSELFKDLNSAYAVCNSIKLSDK